MKIREAEKRDWEAIWPFFRDIVLAGETYGYDRETTKEEGVGLWMEAPRKTYVIEEDGCVLGSFYIKTNHDGGGDHVCNCGYMVSPKARGRGCASAMCNYSQKVALELGYKAMQFNFVISSNEVAVKLWQKLGYAVVGRLPKAFAHPRLGYVDALVMYKWLVEEN